jgi:O-antigen ligase
LLERLITFTLIFIIFFAPLSFGAQNSIIWAETTLFLAILTLFYLFMLNSIKSGVISYRKNILNLFFSLFALYALLQLCLGISIYPHRTLLSLKSTLIYLCLFFVIVNNYNDRKGLSRVVLSVIAAGFVVSLLGILQHVTAADKIYWLREYRWKDFFGPFITANHFAFYTSIVALLTLGMLSVLLHEGRENDWEMPLRQQISALLSNMLNGKTLFVSFAFVIMVAAVFLSKSRAGILFFFCALAFFILSTLSVRRFKNNIFVISLCLAAAYLIISGIGIEKILADLSSLLSGGGYAGRVNALNDSLKIFKDYPLFGTGLGTFAYSLLTYKSFNLAGEFWRHLHNDNLQLVIEAGIFGTAAIVSPLIAFTIKMSASAHRTLSRYKYYILSGLLSAFFYALLHNTLEFGMRINAITSLLVICLALAVLATRLRHGQEVEAETASILKLNTTKEKTALYIALTALFICSSFLTAQPLMAHLLTRGDTTPQRFDLALKIDKKNDDLYYRYYLFLIKEYYKDRLSKDEFIAEAAEALDMASKANPFAAKYPVAKGDMALWMGNNREALDLYREAVLKEPKNPYVILVNSYAHFAVGVSLADERERSQLLQKSLVYYRLVKKIPKKISIEPLLKQRGLFEPFKEYLKSHGEDPR